MTRVMKKHREDIVICGRYDGITLDGLAERAQKHQA